MQDLSNLAAGSLTAAGGMSAAGDVTDGAPAAQGGPGSAPAAAPGTSGLGITDTRPVGTPPARFLAGYNPAAVTWKAIG